MEREHHPTHSEGLDSIVVEQPKVEDAEAIRDLVYRTWLATYINEEQGVTREHIDADFSESRTEEGMRRRREALANPPQGWIRLCARAEDGTIIGTIHVKQHTNENELSMIYVAPEAHGQGIGTRLWNAARHYLDRSKPTVVRAVAYNEQAIKFYEHLGFQQTDEQDAHTFGTEQGVNVPGVVLRRAADEKTE